MIINLLRLFGPGIVETLRVMWSPEGGGTAGSGQEGEGQTVEETQHFPETQQFQEKADPAEADPLPGGKGAAGETGALREQYGAALAQLGQLYRAREDVVPEMVRGESVAELEASFQRAREAYDRVRARVLERGNLPVEPSKPGTGPKPGVEPEIMVPVAPGGGTRGGTPGTGPGQSLTPLQKIALGLNGGQPLSR